MAVSPARVWYLQASGVEVADVALVLVQDGEASVVGVLTEAHR